MHKQKGFTLIELLIAITLMAVLAGLSWRGLDSLMRSRDITQAQVNQTAVLQTVLAQWQADLNAIQAAPNIADAGVLWDGRTLRITRRATAWRADGADAGLWVVAALAIAPVANSRGVTASVGQRRTLGPKPKQRRCCV